MDLAAEVATWPVKSASVAVVGPGGVIDIHDDGHVRQWASVTKVLSALTVLDGVAEGLVRLDDQVGPPGATLRHLLAHTSGLAVDANMATAPVAKRRTYSNRGIDLAAEHLCAVTGRTFATELGDRVLDLLDMNSTRLDGPAAQGAIGAIGDLAKLADDLLTPTLLLPQVVHLASTPTFPDLVGVLPGFGRQVPDDWGLGCEIRGHKSPHWTSPDNSPRTFGHFGQSGAFIWVDPDARLACVSQCDRVFGMWARHAWPALSTKVLHAYA